MKRRLQWLNHKWYVWVIAVSVLLFSLVLGFFLRGKYEYIESDPRFCQSCHTDPLNKWKTSSHHLVTCDGCHKKATRHGLRQVWYSLIGNVARKDGYSKPDSKVCLECHGGNDPQWKLVTETEGHQVHFGKAGIDCLTCHLGGVHKFLRPVDSCMNCHENSLDGSARKMAFLHCLNCHNFLGKGKELRPERASCWECHKNIRVGKETFSDDAPAAHLDCPNCHKPHDKDKIRPDRGICLVCHPAVSAGHHGMRQGASCTSCHQPHS